MNQQTHSCSPLCISLLGTSTCWVWCVCKRYPTVMNTQCLWLEPHSPHMTQSYGRLITHLVTNVQNAEHLFLCSHNASISHPIHATCWIPAQLHSCGPCSCESRFSRAASGPDDSHTSKNNTHPCFTLPLTIHMDTMHVKANMTDTKDIKAHNKSEKCESDFLIEAITHIIQSHF